MGKTINTILNLTDKFTPKLNEAGKEALIFKEKLKNCNTAANSIDKGLSKLAKTAVVAGAAGVAAMGAFAKSSLDTYKDFQQSMSNVAGILSVDTTSETYKKLESAAREAGKSTTKTAQESADALSYMALAGWSVEDSMNGLMPILRASEATGADLATTSDLVTDSMSALGLQTNQLGNYLDVCARAQNKSNTTLTQMQEAYIGCGATFKNFNTELDESGALLGIIANRGIKGSEAGNSLQSTLVNLTKQSGESYKAMQALGVSAYDSQGKFKGVSNVLLELNDKTKNLTEEQRNNYLTMIAGKTQLTTLNALMAGLTNTLSNGKTEFQDLREQLQSCNGSLDKMANTMTNNLSGAMARAQSATDDFKITVGKKLEPYVTQFFNWFSAKLPNATEKFAVFLDNKVPRAINFCKNAFEKIKPTVSFIIRNFSELAIAGGTVVAGLKAFSIAVKVSSFINKLKGTMTSLTVAQKLATICQTAFNTSLLACPITWIVAIVAAAGAGFLIWKKHMEKADIAKHFGDITLSAEECSNIVKNVFGSETIQKVEATKTAYEQFEESLQKTSDSAKELKKLNFRISLGDTTISQDDYMATVDDYVANLQTAIKDKQYSLSLNIDLLFDGSDYGNTFLNDSNNYYNALIEQGNGLGEDLKEAVKNAYDHNWDFDSSEAVAAIMKHQAEIQEKIATAQSEAKLETLKYDFSTGDLSQESFENLINAGTEQMNTLKETYNNARVDAIASAKLMYSEGSAELQKAIEESNNAYNQKMAEASAKNVQFQVDAIKQAYPELGDSFYEAFQSAINNSGKLEAIDKQLAAGMEVDYTEIQGALEEAMEKATSAAGISDEARDNLKGFFEKMVPSVEELESTTSKLKTIPAEFTKTLNNAEMLGAAANNAAALRKVASDALGKATETDLSSAKKGGEAIGKSFGDDADSQSNKANAVKGANALRKALKEQLEKSMTVTVPVVINTSESTGDNNNASNKTDDNAVGTTYFGGGLTTINEHGYEVIDLPQGTRIYPHSQSEKMMNNNSPNVSVSVNVNGNIFGLENAAELIGSMVCDKIVESIKAV